MGMKGATFERLVCPVTGPDSHGCVKNFTARSWEHFIKNVITKHSLFANDCILLELGFYVALTWPNAIHLEGWDSNVITVECFTMMLCTFLKCAT